MSFCVDIVGHCHGRLLGLSALVITSTCFSADAFIGKVGGRNFSLVDHFHSGTYLFCICANPHAKGHNHPGAGSNGVSVGGLSLAQVRGVRVGSVRKATCALVTCSGTLGYGIELIV